MLLNAEIFFIWQGFWLPEKKNEKKVQSLLTLKYISSMLQETYTFFGGIIIIAFLILGKDVPKLKLSPSPKKV